ncbi:hypothetical protein DERF_000300 [Dermatophagoides farinae]|uniref:Uncharacterized protein n=1 Tax=Dermatophagoides farinae TaxID=6954 RepID=A0A922I737_DERFA|nr:hypothetical protein DERF_000300 [Dermatophagoides farinae]
MAYRSYRIIGHKTYCRQRITLPNTVPVHLKLFATNCTINLNGDNHQQGLFPNMKNNEINVPESQKQMPVRTGTTWPPNIINAHPSVRPSIYAAYMIRPTGAEQHLTTAISNPSSLQPMHVSYDYDMASAGGPFLNQDQNGQSPPLFELLSRHSYGRDRTNKAESISDNQNSDSVDQSANVNHQQPQTNSIITPILNGASRMFWKFWTNFNQPPSPTLATSTTTANHSAYGMTSTLHSHQMASASSGTFGMRAVPSSPMTIQQPIVDRILILSPMTGVSEHLQKPEPKLGNDIDNNMNVGQEILSQFENEDDQENTDIKNNNQNDNEIIGTSKKPFLGAGADKHYILYSIIPMGSTNNDEQRSSMSPIRHTTATIMLQPIHLINTYQVIPSNNYNDNNNNMMISTTMMTPIVSSSKNRNLLSPSAPPLE